MANALLSADTFENWCPTCCSPHEPAAVCPGPLPATGEERYGWRLSVRTPHGIEAYGILVAASDRLWRARIITRGCTAPIFPDFSSIQVSPGRRITNMLAAAK